MLEKIAINDNALKIRKKLGEDCESPINIFSLIESNENFTLVFHPMSDSISGLCIKDGENMIVGINSRLSLGRQRYTIAHELCHLYYHNDSTCYVCNKNFKSIKDNKEKEADMFASYFLAPYGALKNYVNKQYSNNLITIENVVNIEQYFGLSRLATLVRLNQEGYIDNNEFEDLSNYGVASTAQGLGYSCDLYKPRSEEKQKYTLGKYIKLTNNIFQLDLISLSKYEELLLEAFRDDIVYGNGGDLKID